MSFPEPWRPLKCHCWVAFSRMVTSSPEASVSSGSLEDVCVRFLAHWMIIRNSTCFPHCKICFHFLHYSFFFPVLSLVPWENRSKLERGSWYGRGKIQPFSPSEEKVADTAIMRVSSGISAPGLGTPVLSPSFVPKLWVYNIHSVYVMHIEFEHFLKSALSLVYL